MEKVLKSSKQKIREMTILAMFMAIIAILGLVPGIGFIVIFPNLLNGSIVHIPVLIGGILLGRKGAIILGIEFGVVSLLASLYIPGIFNAVFIFPWVSILPRFLFGLVIYDITMFFVKLLKKRLLAYMVSFFLLSILHSFLVLPIMFASYPILYGAASITEMLKLFSGGTSVSMALGLIGALVASEAVFSMLIGGVVTDRIEFFLKPESAEENPTEGKKAE